MEKKASSSDIFPLMTHSAYTIYCLLIVLAISLNTGCCLMSVTECFILCSENPDQSQIFSGCSMMENSHISVQASCYLCFSQLQEPYTCSICSSILKLYSQFQRLKLLEHWPRYQLILIFKFPNKQYHTDTRDCEIFSMVVFSFFLLPSTSPLCSI